MKVTGDSPQPEQTYHPGEGMYPKQNPGSNTYPLDVVAAFSDDKKTLTIAVSAMSVNIYELPISE